MKSLRTAVPSLLLAGALALAGCRGKDNSANQRAEQAAPPPNPAGLSQDQSGPTSSGSYPTPGPGANGAGGGNAAPSNPPVAPNGTNQGGTPLPGVNRSNTPPPAPKPIEYTAPAGTTVEIRTNNTISSRNVQVGDHFSGVLERPIVVQGHEIVPKGEPVDGEVVAANQKGRFRGPGDLAITVREIGHHRVETSDYERVVKGRGGRTAMSIGGGAGLGALIGGLAGHGRGALIGGLAGAGAGTAVAATGNRSVVIPAETLVHLTLRSPLTVEETPGGK